MTVAASGASPVMGGTGVPMAKLALLPGPAKHAILSPPAGAGMEEPAVGCVAWRKLSGSAAAPLLRGSDARLLNGVIDRICFRELGILQRGDRTEVDNNMQVTAQVATNGTHSFTILRHVFATIHATRRDSHEHARLAPGYNVGDVRKALHVRLVGADATARERFHKRCSDDWPFETGAGAAVIAGGLLSLLVIYLSRDSTPLMVMTTNLALLLAALSVAKRVFAVISTIKTTRIDPAVVFSR